MTSAILVGRTTRDPELKVFPKEDGTEVSVTNFTLACDGKRYRGNDKPEASFINCVAFGKQAEFVKNNFPQGVKMILRGRLDNNNYTNKDGHKVYSMHVIAEEIEFAESKASRQTAAPEEDEGFMNIPEGIEGQLPFN